MNLISPYSIPIRIGSFAQMPSSQTSSLFSLPLAHWQQPQSYRIAKYESKKRARDSLVSEGDESDNEDIIDQPSTSFSTPGSSSLVLTPNEAHQYRIAGLPFDNELPGGKFPHAAPPSDIPARITRKEIDVEMSQLSPPIYEPKSSTQSRNTRLQHLSVLTTILHRCLLQGDYIRAGRAWGLILREEFSGITADVRTQGRWGIGAEIILRRDLQNTDSENINPQKFERSSAETSKPWFTRKGFEEAKNYYERLILQYPYRRSAPNSVGPLDFYPAMFGLWVYVAQEESRSSREVSEELGGGWGDDSDGDEEDEDLSMSSNVQTQRKGKKAPISQILEKEFQEAQQIATRMDEVMVSPPYSDSVELLRLRGMVSLWIGGLHLSKENFGEEDDRQTPESTDEEMESTYTIRQQRRSVMEKKHAEVEKANEFFGKAKERTKAMSLSLESLHLEE